MALSDLSSIQLQRLVHLIKEKETILTQLDRINQSLEALQNGTPSQAASPAIRSRRRVALKPAILKALGHAGKTGLTIAELAQKLKAKPGSVSVWFYTTGKKTNGIKKVGKGKFAYLKS